MSRGSSRQLRDPCEICRREPAEGSISGIAVGAKCRARTMAIKRDAERDQFARRRTPRTKPSALRRVAT